jgi:hypothetical protein
LASSPFQNNKSVKAEPQDASSSLLQSSSAAAAAAAAATSYAASADYLSKYDPSGGGGGYGASTVTSGLPHLTPAPSAAAMHVGYIRDMQAYSPASYAAAAAGSAALAAATAYSEHSKLHLQTS